MSIEGYILIYILGVLTGIFRKQIFNEIKKTLTSKKPKQDKKD